jgi:hypothetical protein
MDESKKETKNDIKRKEYLDDIGQAMQAIYRLIHRVPEQFRNKFRDIYSALVKLYSES